MTSSLVLPYQSARSVHSGQGKMGSIFQIDRNRGRYPCISHLAVTTRQWFDVRCSLLPECRPCAVRSITPSDARCDRTDHPASGFDAETQWQHPPEYAQSARYWRCYHCAACIALPCFVFFDCLVVPNPWTCLRFSMAFSQVGWGFSEGHRHPVETCARVWSPNAMAASICSCLSPGIGTDHLHCVWHAIGIGLATCFDRVTQSRRDIHCPRQPTFSLLSSSMMDARN